MSISLDTARTFAIDLAERALNAAWQGAAGAAVPVLIATDATDVAHASWWLQLGAISVAGGLSATGSLIKGVVAGAKTGTASLSPTVAQTAVLPGAHATDAGSNGPVVVPDVPTELDGLPPLAPIPTAPDPTAHADTEATA